MPMLASVVTCGRGSRRARGSPRWICAASAVTSAWRSIAGLDDREFVAAEARDEVGAADAAAQAVGDRLEQLVADRDGRANR